MKNRQKGFIVPLLISIIAVLVIGGGIYVFEQSKPQQNEQQPITNNQVSQTNAVVVENSAFGLKSNPVSFTVALKSAQSNPIVVPGMNQYTDSNFGFSFWYPSTWSVKQSSVTDSATYTGDTIIKNLVVAPTQDSNNGISVEEFVSSDKGINDNTGCGPADGCPTSIRYYFDSSTHTWMIAEYGIDNNPQSNNIIPAKVDMNSMGGLHVLQGNARFGDDVIVPLSANHFLVIRNVSAGTNQVRFLANTVVASDPSVATPVNSIQQIQVIQAEGSEYASYKW